MPNQIHKPRGGGGEPHHLFEINESLLERLRRQLLRSGKRDMGTLPITLGQRVHGSG